MDSNHREIITQKYKLHAHVSNGNLESSCENINGMIAYFRLKSTQIKMVQDWSLADNFTEYYQIRNPVIFTGTDLNWLEQP